MTPCPWPIEELLPHAPPMLLLDEVLVCDDQGSRAAVTIGPGFPFIEPSGVPAHVGIEFMAQTCGLWAGGRARVHGRPARLGYLLGTRRYRALEPFFPLGARLEVSAQIVFLDGGMGVFDCRVEDRNGTVLAEAQVNVFQPEEEGTQE
ncbi:MAG: 3-hydroxylacyl-ACP dehydratase [Magnetospirillum gryphiswaldense]|nr:3-hydroxylacyl-ACP dehydratase [Magnetospirillum gryphiswaldense]